MAVRYLFDTNCCIYLFSGTYSKLINRVLETTAGDIGLSAITFAELAWGSNQGKPPDQAALNLLAAQMPVLPFDAAAADIYGRLPFKRGSFDRLIAAHSLSLGLTFVTHNVADFADIPDLCVEDWTS